MVGVFEVTGLTIAGTVLTVSLLGVALLAAAVSGKRAVGGKARAGSKDRQGDFQDYYASILKNANRARNDPSAENVSTLRWHWLRVATPVRKSNDPNGKADPHLEAVASAVATALGLSAACDNDYHNFEQDELITEDLGPIRAQRASWITECEELIDEHNALIEGDDKDKQERELKALRDQIANLSKRIEESTELINGRMRQRERKFSPGYILLKVLGDSQAYTTTVRQGAAWGLHFLLTRGNLDEPTREEIFETISKAAGGDNAIDFCERRVQLLPGSEWEDFVEALRDGLQWMDDIAEGTYTGGQAGEAAEGGSSDCPLEETVALIGEHIPGALEFLERYPLRLMRLDYQRQIIGKFVRDGCELEWWTRYTPPLKVGPVEQRYLKVRDRSVPNSMGIYFRLFHHPFLAVSVIYHEQLHYGGPGGNPGQGIENETETLLRETIFARGLMAKIAPSADSEIPGFERSLVQQARGLRLEHMLAQLIAPVEDVDYLEPLNDSVEKAYGEQLTPAQAKRKSDINLEERNLKIHIENVTQTWCPEVEFPKLGTAAASTVTSRYRKVLFDRWTRSNRLSAADHARIFKDRHCAPWLRAWSEYCQRPGATTELAQASGHGIDWLNHLLGDGLSAEIESPSPDSLAPEFLAMLEQIQQQRGLSADHDDDE